MIVRLNIPWHRYALIAELSRRLQGRSPQFGKTAVQKMIYLLQEVFRVNCGYNFDLYTYGPFAAQILQDVDVAESIGGVSVHPVGSRSGGYEIRPGERLDSLRQKASEFLDRTDVQKAIVALIDEFGHLSAKELELRSTIVYVQRDLARQAEPPSPDEVINIVKRIKPKFADVEIRAAFGELRQKSYVK
jgi:uncharacterized protein YwgA